MRKEILKKLGFKKEVEEVDKGKCPMCGVSIIYEGFRDLESFQEYLISGLCQKCQDKIFK